MSHQEFEKFPAGVASKLRTYVYLLRCYRAHYRDPLHFWAYGTNRDDLPSLVEINLLDSNLDAEHDGRKRQAEFLLNHVEKTHCLLTVILAVDSSL